MRRIPRWVQPLVGGVLALVLGFGGAVLGARVANGGSVFGESPLPPTVVEAGSVPVIPVEALPADEGDLEALFDTAVTEAGASASTTPVVLGDSPALESAAVDAFLDEVAASTDPEGTAGSPDVVDLSPATDYCLADEDAADCPAGLEATVLALEEVPALRVISAGSATADPGGIGAECLLSGDVALAVVTNQPVWLTATWYGDAGTGTAEGHTEYEAAKIWGEANDELDPRDPSWATVTTCVYPLDLVAGADYEAHIDVLVDEGTAEPDPTADSTFVRLPFDGSGGPARPVARIFTAGAGDVVVATVPHRDGETVAVTPIDLSTPADPGCVADAPAVSADHVRSLGAPRVRTVSEEELLARNELPDMTRVTTVGFAVNEGLTVRFCVLVTTASGAVDYGATAVVRTVDRLVPVISLSAAISQTRGQTVHLQGYQGNGRRCGSYDVGVTPVGSYAAFAVDTPLCDYRSAAGTGGAGWPSDQPLPVSSGVLDRYTVTLDDDLDDDASTPLTIDLRRDGWCVSRCVPPPDSFHSLLWQSPDGLQQAWFVVRVHWEQGNANGALVSNVSGFADPANPDGVPDGRLRLDTATAVLVQSGFDPETRNASATIDLRADQVGFYQARLVPAPGSGPMCARDTYTILRSGPLGEPGPASQPWLDPVRVEFDGLCAGADYQVIVTLTAVDGAVSVWGSDRIVAGAPRDAYIGGDWAGSRVHIAEVERRLEIRYELDDHTTGTAPLRPVFVSAQMDGLDVIGPRENICFARGTHLAVRTPRVATLALGEQVHLSGTLEIALDPCRAGWRLDPGATPVGWQADFSLTQVDGNVDGFWILVDPVAEATELPGGQFAGSTGIRIHLRWVDVPTGG